MKRELKYLLYPLLFFQVALLKANAISDSSVAYYYFSDGRFAKHGIDSSLYEFHRYNPVFQQNNFMAWNGNLGLQSQSLFFKPNHRVGFDFGVNSYNLISILPNNYQYFDVKRPVSEVFYVNGFQKEQQISLFHTQNIKRNWNAGFKLIRTRSEGMFNRQQSNNASFTFFTSYNTKNMRYRIFSNYIRNKLFIQENGGVDDTSFVDIGFGSKRSVQVNLPNAYNKRLNNNFNITQYYYFGKIHSSDTAFIKNKFTHFISHSSSLNYLNTRFEDGAPSPFYYDTLIIDNRITIDTFHIEQSSHRIEIGTSAYNSAGMSRNFNYAFGITNQSNSIRQYYKKLDNLFYYYLQNNKFGNNIADACATYIHKNWLTQFNGSFAFTGYNRGDVYFQLSSLYSLKDTSGSTKSKLFTKAEFSAKRPDYFNSFYTSNSFFWINEFKQQQSTSVTLFYNHVKSRFKTEVAWHLVNNFIYYDTLAISRQSNTPISVVSLLLNKDFVLGHFHLNNRVLFQHVSNNYLLRIPDLMLRHSLYYENYLFKKALLLQVGFDLNYLSSYYAYAFMPATSQYYLQDKRIVGNYPFVDFFVNAVIGRARLFLKSDHLNAGFFGNVYYNLYRYPNPDRALYKVGISWSLLN